MPLSAVLIILGLLCLSTLQLAVCEKPTISQLTTSRLCLNATYHVQQLYQQCPPKGRVISPPGSPGKESDLAPRVNDLEDKYKALEAQLAYLAAQKGGECGSSGDKGHDVVKDKVHKVTRKDGSFPADCTEIFRMGYRCTGIYWLKPKFSPKSFKALCELSYDGWTVLMRRYNGKEDFFRKWSDYKHGFGSLSTEHWLGNDNIHFLTNQKNYMLRVDITRTNSYSYYADYSRFKVESEAHKYKLHVTGYSGTSGYDRLANQNNMYFSTWDKDHDRWSSHCAQSYKGGWWYNACYKGHLTGKGSRFIWNSQLKGAVMKVKPI